MSNFAGRMRSSAFRWLCGLFFVFCFGASHAQSLSKMALLLPDGLVTTNVQVTAWTDAAQEQGYQLSILRNSAFLLAGAGIRTQYSGIIVPDGMQFSMSDTLVSAIQNYVTQGGNLMLVFDAGALTDTGFYAVPKSRFSNLVGVDYVLYDALRDQTVGLGPVIGGVSMMRAILVPPGKSMPYTAPPAQVLADSSTAQARAIRVANSADEESMRAQKPANAEFLRVSPANPGGLKGYDHSLYFKPPPAVKGRTGKGLKREGMRLRQPSVIERPQVPNVTRGVSEAPRRANSGAVTSEYKDSGKSGPKALVQLPPAPAGEPVHAISGYYYGALTYPSYVTQGTAQGAVLFSSPQHGLVASSRTFGSGTVLFVNLPLTYLKLSEDAMPLHGFLHLFARGQLKQPRLTNVPNGVGGLAFNWHLDSQEALESMRTLKSMGIWNNKPFSIDITAGPDTIDPGDKLGFNLPSNNAAKKFLRDFDLQGHAVGSHGGWIHDYYGTNANETNSAQFLPYLVLNRDAVQAVIGHPSRGYSAPQGNNPLWALNWLEQNGVGSYYSLSHTGTAATRTYRGGQLVNPSMWAIPLTPFGVAATFEEFQDLQFSQAEVSQWYSQLIDFAVQNETNRMVYAHPPGAADWPNVIAGVMTYAKQKQLAGVFKWYTFPQLADFMNLRATVTWSSAVASTGKMRVTASHPTSLKTLAWAYPKSLYSMPVRVSGTMSIVDQGTDWLVRPTSKSATFEAAPL